jgi:murein L,D-transpeptidase YcbB/YkuD
MFSFQRLSRAAWLVFASFVLSPAVASAATEASGESAPSAAGSRMIYVDAALAPEAGGAGGSVSKGRTTRGAAIVNPLAARFEGALADYRARWAGLPEVQLAAGPALRPGSAGPRVRSLRARLGLDEEGTFDAALTEALLDYKRAHGLGTTPVADAATFRSLNRGAAHYEQIIEANLQRARALPADLGRRYIIVDTAAARLSMYEDGRPVDTMRVIVGRPGSQTPMLAAYVRHAVLNPYWNVPPDLVRSRIAPNALNLGPTYLRERGYEVLSGYDVDAEPVDPTGVDWAAVVAGRQDVRIRQRPGPGNMMGDVKFMLSDDLGIYLHDTPDRNLFAGADRRQSSGCIRLEDPERLGRWLFGRPLVAQTSRPELRVELPEPVPVYVTYFTVEPTADGLVFRDDGYGLDRQVLASRAD